MELRYDPVAEQWSYVNVPQNFIDTNSFTSNDPQFKYGNTSDQDNQDDQDDADPCPPGFRQVTLNDGTKVCMQIEEPIQQDRGGDNTPEPPKTDPLQQSFRENKEAMESFFELKNEGKIDFNTYDPKTNLVEYNRNPNETTLGQLAKAFIPGVAGIEFIDNAMDEAELKKAGMLITDENGKQFIDLKTSYEVLVTKVMNPGVPEGNVLANTPGYYGLEDSNNFYKNIFNDMTVKKEDMKILGSTDVGILSDELIKAEDKFKNSKSNFGDFSVMGNTYFYKGNRLDQSEINKLIQSGITKPKDIIAEIEKDRQKYTEFLRQPTTGSIDTMDEDLPVDTSPPEPQPISQDSETQNRLREQQKQDRDRIKKQFKDIQQSKAFKSTDFSKDRFRAPKSGKSYTQSKIEDAAKSGFARGF